MDIETLNLSVEPLNELMSQVSVIGHWMQGLSLFIIIWLIFQIFYLAWNLRKLRIVSDIKKEMLSLKKDIKQINQKMDKVLVKKTRKRKINR